MRHLIIIALLGATACASPTRYVKKGFDGAEKGLKALDIGLDLAADVYASAYDANEKYCIATLGPNPTSEAKDACTRAFRNADEIAKKAKQASDLYDVLVEVLEDMKKVSVELAREVERASKDANQ